MTAKASGALEVVIPRSKWMRGETANGDYFDDDTGHACVLGHVALATRGVPPDDVDHKTIEGMAVVTDAINEMRRHIGLCDRGGISAVNDSPCMSDRDREADLADRLAEAGVRLTFTDEASP